MEQCGLKHQSFVVFYEAAGADSRGRNMFSSSLLERSSVEQFSLLHILLPDIQNRVSGSVAVYEHYFRPVLGNTVEEIPVLAPAERSGLTTFQVYNECLLLRSFPVITMQICDALIYRAFDGGYLFVLV